MRHTNRRTIIRCILICQFPLPNENCSLMEFFSKFYPIIRTQITTFVKNKVSVYMIWSVYFCSKCQMIHVCMIGLLNSSVCMSSIKKYIYQGKFQNLHIIWFKVSVKINNLSVCTCTWKCILYFSHSWHFENTFMRHNVR